MASLPGEMACYLVSKESGRVSAQLANLPTARLPQGDVLLRADWSSLNYKDALAATGHPGVVRHFPHVPGIDAAGTVVESGSPRFAAGEQVLVTGYELGAGRWGGFAEFVRVPDEWLVPLPDGLSLRESMILGTAGFTSGLSVAALVEHQVAPGAGPIVVTGASGGVGSLAVAILARLGYRVVAISGKPQARDLLLELGAAEVLPRDALDDASGKPLLAARWAGAVDVVGGSTLASVVRSLQPGGCAAACGLVGGADLPLTVYPFILRGASLVGIDSAHCPMPRRLDIWAKLAAAWKPDQLERLVTEIGLGELDYHVAEILAGRTVGRVIVRVGH
jgi:putative YhdH/YhfP family quinone oxidoreductase